MHGRRLTFVVYSYMKPYYLRLVPTLQTLYQNLFNLIKNNNCWYLPPSVVDIITKVRTVTKHHKRLMFISFVRIVPNPSLELVDIDSCGSVSSSRKLYCHYQLSSHTPLLLIIFKDVSNPAYSCYTTFSNINITYNRNVQQALQLKLPNYGEY